MNTRELQKMLEEMRGYIRQAVLEGFDSEEEVCARAVDYLCEKYDPEELRPYAESLTKEAFLSQTREEATWPQETDCDKLDAAFADLEKAGIVGRQNFTCCNNCGSAEIGAEIEDARAQGSGARGYAFYHMQDTERAVLGRGLYLSYGAVESGVDPLLGIANDIVSALRRRGLLVEWNGSPQQRIQVRMDWKRRIAGKCGKETR